MRKSYSSSHHQPRGSSYDDAAAVFPHHRSSNRHSRPSRHQPYSSSGSGSGSGSDEHDDRVHRSSKHYSSRHHSDYSHQDHSSSRHQHRRGHEAAAAGVGGLAAVSKMSRRYARLLPNSPPTYRVLHHPVYIAPHSYAYRSHALLHSRATVIQRYFRGFLTRLRTVDALRQLQARR